MIMPNRHERHALCGLILAIDRLMNKNLRMLSLAFLAWTATCFYPPAEAYAQDQEAAPAQPIETLNDSLRALAHRLEIAQTDLRASNARLDLLRGDLQAMQGRFNASTALLDLLGDSLRATQQGFQASNSRLDSLHEDVQIMQGRQSTSEGRLGLLGDSLTAAQGGLRASNRRLDSLHEDLEAMHGRQNTSEGSLESLRGGLSDTQGTLNTWAIIVAGVLLLIAGAVATGWMWARKTQEHAQRRFHALDDAMLKYDASIAALLETKTSQPVSGPPSKVDHAFPLRVADEINRMENNLHRMDSNVRGHKQLMRSIQRVRNNLQEQGYELVEFLGKPYNDGLLVEAEFTPDENLQPGEQVISRIYRPEVRFGGEVIQMAKIQVSLGV